MSRSLLKEPKIFLWDWSQVKEQGPRVENFIACHLLKAVHYWNDMGLGNYALHYLRDKDKREVDFIITKDQAPWALFEVKSGDNQRISEHLLYFNQLLQPDFTFQVCYDMPYVDRDCFSVTKPTIVPAKTLLSQLV